MVRHYYLVKNLRTGEESIQLKQDFNINYSWHRPDELKSTKEILQGFKNRTHKIMRVY